MARTAAFTGSAAWPSLTISGGGTAAWNAITYIGTTSPAASAYETISTIVSSASGVAQVTNNIGPVLGTVNSTTRTTDASTYLMPTSNYLPTGSIDCVLICATSVHTADHFHEVNINSSTGSWKGTSNVYTKVAETSWNNGTNFVRQTAWIAYVPSFSVTGQVLFQTSTSQGQSVYNYSGGAYTAVGTAVTTQNFHAHFVPLTGVASGSSYAAAVRTTNNKYASASTGAGPSTITFANNFSYSNNRSVAYFTKIAGATPNSYQITGNGYQQAITVDATVNSSPTSTAAMLYSTVSTSDTQASRLAGPTTTMLWANTTAAWGGFMLEIVDAQVTANSDTVAGTLANYLVYTASGAQSGTESRATISGDQYRSTFQSGSGISTTDVEYGSPGLVARVCNVGGTDYGITAQIYSESKTGATVSNTHNVSLAILSGSTVTRITTASVASSAGVTGGINLLSKRAMRVENNPTNTGLWIAFKAWNPTVAEPAWPEYNTNSTTWAANSIVVSITDTATTGVSTVAGTTGTAGLLFPLYASNSATTRTATETYGAVSAYSDLVIQNATVTITGAGSLSASGAAVVSTSIASSGGTGTGSLAASGIAIVEASVTAATGAGTLASDGYAVVSGSSTATGTGSLNATSEVIVLGDATLTNASSTLTTTEELVVVATATLTGTGTLTADAEVVSISIVTGTVTASGSGTLTADGYAIASETATISGTGTLSATPTLIAFTTTSPSGDGTLSGNGYGVLVDTATISGTGTLSADSAVTAFTTVSPHGTGSLTASPTLIATTNATSSGNGSLTAAGYAAPAAGAGLYGQGSLVATAKVIAYTDASLSGSSSGTTSGYAISATTVTTTGTGSLASDATTLCVAQATCTGAGAAEAFANTTVVGDASLVGTSSGSVEAALIAYADAALQGVSSGTVTSFGLHFAAAECSGVGSMVVDGKWVHYIPNTLRITQTRKVAEATFLAQPVMADGTPIYNGAQTTKKVNSGIFTTEPQEK